MMHEQNVDSSTTPSNGQFYLDVTFKKQVEFQHDHNTFFKIRKHQFYSTGSHDISRFPELFFGIGNMTEKVNSCLIDFKLLNIKDFLYYELNPSKYVGVVVHHQRMRELSKSISTRNQVYTDEGYTNTGAGLSFLFDKRDNIFNPKKGHFIQGGAIRYASHMHLRSGFTNLWLDVRYYKMLPKKIILNTNVCLFNNIGTVPFRMMPALGGSRFLRGYYMGRFRDNNAAIARGELRKMLVKRFGVAIFGDVGKVYNHVRQFGTNQLNCSGGIGLRIRHDLKTDANIRIDYGRSRDSHGLYIVFAEAF